MRKSADRHRADAVIRFDDIVVTRGGRRVLDAVAATVPQGRVTVVAGPSGVGKTTLLRLCNRLDVPDAGRVLYHERDIAELDPLALRREVAMIFQRPVMVRGTVADNLALSGARTARFAAALGQTELDASFLERPADELSGGEAQRVSFARALLSSPEVLLADEPTAGLDTGPRLALERLAQRLVAQEGLTVLWVTHDIDQLRRLAEHVVVLLEGRVAYAGAPAGLDDDRKLAAFLQGGAT